MYFIHVFFCNINFLIKKYSLKFDIWEIYWIYKIESINMILLLIFWYQGSIVVYLFIIN